MSSPVMVAGTASVFEAALVVTLEDPTGKELASKSALASIGAPERGIYATQFDLPTTSPRPLVVKAFSRSPRDGTPINIVSVTVTLVP